MKRLNYQLRSVNIEGNTLTGIAHVFGTRALVDGQYESFSPTAFDSSIAANDVASFANHNAEQLLGRTSSGTLRIERDDEALSFSVDLPDTSYAHDLKELVKRGDLTGVSFGFLPGKYERRSHNGKAERRHTNVERLIEISPVSLPAFDGTSLSLRQEDFSTDSIESQLVVIRHRVNIGG